MEANQRQGPTRQLSAIMFTDMVGYTALMQENERRAKDSRDRHRNVLRRAVEANGGRILQFYGDGTLSVFPSAVTAVLSALTIQREVRQEPPIPLRIGLHIGDIVEEEGDILGDGVNVASRIQSLAVPGSVLLSDKVFDEIKNQAELPAVYVGLFELKNVKRPVNVYALKAEGVHVPALEELDRSTTGGASSIAVLPFVNMSSDAENEYFSDGISEEIINALTKVQGLRVTARTSSFAFKGKNHDVREIGRQLNVVRVLEGSVRKAGSKVRITAQLINTATGFHEWSEVYDRQLEDVFAIQDEISGTITHRLRSHMEGVSGKRSPSGPRNMEAYARYLKALHHWNKWTPDDSRRAIVLLEEAARIDPEFSLAYAWQACAYTYLGALGQLKPDIAFPAARKLVQKAFSLQGAPAESHLADGLIALFYDWEWSRAERRFRETLEISPSWASAHHMYGMFLTVIGDVESAVKEVELAHSLDPMSLIVNFALAETYLCARRFHDALEQYNHTLLLDPTFRAARNGLCWVLIGMGEVDRAIGMLERSRMDIGDELKGWSELGYAYAVAGRRDDALECLRKLELRRDRDKDAELTMDIAVVQQGLGDKDAVFRHLNEAVDKRVGGVVFMQTHPGWDELRSDPRFADLLERIGFRRRGS